MKTEQPTELVYRGFTIWWDAKGVVNLTVMWKAAGAPKHQKPHEWLRLPASIDLIEVPATNTELSRIGR
jgi:hypothetical protein